MRMLPVAFAILAFALAGPFPATAHEPQSWPSSLRPFGEGYPSVGDLCRRLAESPATNNYLDDSADLVGCPTEAAAKQLGGRIVGVVAGITLVSVPTRSRATASPKSALTSACLARVAREGSVVEGVDHVRRSEKKVEVYVKVRGAKALWRCVGDRFGRVRRVEYTEFEGRL